MAEIRVTRRAGNFLGHRHSAESNEKNRLSHLGRKASARTRAKMSAFNLGQWTDPEYRAHMLALRQTPEFRANARARMLGNKNGKGRKLSRATKKKISAALMGRQSPLRGIARSPETRAKVSAALTGKKQSAGTIRKRIAKLLGRKRSAEQRDRIRRGMLKYAGVACAVTGCDVRAIAKGLCGKHWRSNRIYGDPLFAWSDQRKRATLIKLLHRALPKHLARIKYRGHSFRSSYEVRFVKLLNRGKVKWQYEPRRFNLGSATYTPDFFLPEYDLWCEVKGWLTAYAENKIQLFRKLYPDHKLIIIPSRFFERHLDSAN